MFGQRKDGGATGFPLAPLFLPSLGLLIFFLLFWIFPIVGRLVWVETTSLPMTRGMTFPCQISPEKREVKDKSDDWIARRMNRLDPKGYVEEIYSFQHFGRNSKSFALKIIAIADWGRGYMELGLNYPIPVFPAYLFNWFSESCQAVGQAPMKPDYLQQYGMDVRGRCVEAWTLMLSILQFWTNEESIKDREIFGGWVCPISALAEYVMETINPHLEETQKVMWEVMHRTS